MKYRVKLKWVYSDVVEVEAESEDEAFDLAVEQGEPNYDYLDDSVVTEIGDEEG